MSEPEDSDDHHHTLRERLDAAHAAAEEVVAEESGQLGGEVSALALPFEQVIAAVGAAINPESIGEHGGDDTAAVAEPEGSTPPA